MAVYKMNDIMKTLDKLFKYNINTTEKLANIKWQDLDSIGEFSPFEKSLIMDFKVVIDENYKTNKRRNVNKGAKGIALLEEKNGQNYLKHVFDVSDTHNYRGTKLNLWKVDEKYNDDIIESLEAQFGDLENKSSLAEAIIH